MILDQLTEKVCIVIETNLVPNQLDYILRDSLTLIEQAQNINEYSTNVEGVGVQALCELLKQLLPDELQWERLLETPQVTETPKIR